MPPAAWSTARRASIARSIRSRAGSSTTPKRSGRTCSPSFARSPSRQRRQVAVRDRPGDYQPARNVRRVRPAHRPAAAQRDRLAVPPRRRRSAGAARRRARRDRAQQDRPEARHVFLRLEAEVAARRNSRRFGGKLESGDALVGTIDAYLIYRLTGGEVFATDHTNASRTLLYDIGRLRWDEELCSLFDVPMRALPEVRESFAAVRRNRCGRHRCPASCRSAA